MPVATTYRSKAVRLAADLGTRIRAGQWPTGSFLPPETTLAEEMGVARETLRRCLRLLEADRVLQRIPHRGLVVTIGGEAPIVPPGVRRRSGSPRITTIAVLAPTDPSEGVELMLSGIREFAAEHHAEVQFIASVDDVAHPLRLLNRIDQLGVAGVIILPYPGEDHRAELEALAARNFPMVVIERRSSDLAVPAIEIDNRAAMYRVVRHLLASGRRPVHYLGMRASHQTDHERFEGWRRAMVDAGYAHLLDSHAVLHDWDTSDPRYWHADSPWKQGEEIAERLFAQGEHFYSIACQKDHIAWGCLRAAAARGLVVGQQVLVTGFDDLSVAATLDPPLTTVRQPWYAKGWRAAWLLQRQLDGPHPGPLLITLPTDFIRRQSA